MFKSDSSILLIIFGVISLVFLSVTGTEKFIINHPNDIIKYSLVIVFIYMSIGMVLIGLLMAKGVLTSRYIQALTTKQKAKNKIYPIAISLPIVVYFLYMIVMFSVVIFWKIIWVIVIIFLLFEIVSAWKILKS